MFRLVKLTDTTDITGQVTISLKIPGTFSGLTPTTPGFSGRWIEKVEVFFASPSNGDYIMDVEIIDTDGVVPVPYRAAFPNYPILGTRNDAAMPGANAGLYMTNVPPTEFDPPGGQQYIASGLYLSATFVKGNAAAGEDIYINITWDDGQ